MNKYILLLIAVLALLAVAATDTPPPPLPSPPIPIFVTPDTRPICTLSPTQTPTSIIPTAVIPTAVLTATSVITGTVTPTFTLTATPTATSTPAIPPTASANRYYLVSGDGANQYLTGISQDWKRQSINVIARATLNDRIMGVVLSYYKTACELKNMATGGGPAAQLFWNESDWRPAGQQLVVCYNFAWGLEGKPLPCDWYQSNYGVVNRKEGPPTGTHYRQANTVYEWTAEFGWNCPGQYGTETIQYYILYGRGDAIPPTQTPTQTPTPACIPYEEKVRDPIVGGEGITFEVGSCIPIIPSFQINMTGIERIIDAIIDVELEDTFGLMGYSICPIWVGLDYQIMGIQIVTLLQMSAYLISLAYVFREFRT